MGAYSRDIECSFEELFTQFDCGEDTGDHTFVTGSLGTLSERIGPEAAKAYEKANSLSNYTRLGAAQRYSGRVVLRRSV